MTKQIKTITLLLMGMLYGWVISETNITFNNGEKANFPETALLLPMTPIIILLDYMSDDVIVTFSEHLIDLNKKQKCSQLDRSI